VKAVDVRAKTFTVAVKGEGGFTEYPLTLAKGARIIKDDGLTKKGDTPKEGKLEDITEGMPVNVQLTVDRRVALGVTLRGASLGGIVKGWDSATRVLTLAVKEDGMVIDKVFNVAKEARIDGSLAEGANANVQLSVDDKSIVVGVRVLEKK
jgi:hypothetical protein